jgi:hypothetical protein
VSIVVSDDKLASELARAGSTTLEDSAGRPIGLFFTPEQFRRLSVEWAKENISTAELDAELDADLAAGEGQTLEVIRRRLGA